MKRKEAPVELLTVEEAASRLRLSPRTVYRMLERGALSGTRVGNSWRVPVSALPRQGERTAPVLTATLRSVIDQQIDDLLRRIPEDGFSRYFNEADLAGDLAGALRVAVPREDGEVLIKLSVAGASPRETPDLSVIAPPPLPWVDRRGLPALYSVEFKYFSYRIGAYRLTSRWFRELLEGKVQSMASQFERTIERRRNGLLGAGAMIWVDAFDWLERGKPADREQVIIERAEWFRSRFDRPGSEIRAEYLPMLYPQHRVSLTNLGGRSEPLPSLFGAARPFIRRNPGPDENWDDAISRSIADDYELV